MQFRERYLECVFDFAIMGSMVSYDSIGLNTAAISGAVISGGSIYFFRRRLRSKGGRNRVRRAVVKPFVVGNLAASHADKLPSRSLRHETIMLIRRVVARFDQRAFPHWSFRAHVIPTFLPSWPSTPADDVGMFIFVGEVRFFQHLVASPGNT